MKKLFTVLLSLVLLCNFASPIAYAISAPVASSGKYAVHGLVDEEKRFNIIIDTEEETGQFAILYLHDPDYMYEFCFNLRDIVPNQSNITWNLIETFCFNNENLWSEVYLTTAVVIDKAEEPAEFTFHSGGSTHVPDEATASSEEIDYFEKWLTDKYGDEYSENLLSTTTKNGIPMYLKSGFQAYAYQDTVYKIAQAMTVAGFITGVLGAVVETSILSVISAIVGTGSMLVPGSSVYEYRVRATWYRYVTLVSGEGYPYGMTNKVTFYDGYSYSKTGTCNVDEASAETFYDPSSSVYNSYSKIYEAAYAEYQQIGWQ